MAINAKQIGLWDTLRLQRFVTFPLAIRGFVAPNRLGVALLSWVNAGPGGRRFFGDLRDKYGSTHLWTWFPLQLPFRRTLLVIDPPSMDAALGSTENAPDPVVKKLALSTFVPDGLIISSGDEWQDRRSFNERALDFGRLHRDSGAFTEVASLEAGQLAAKPRLQWADFQLLGERISHQVLFGKGHVDAQMASQLEKMVSFSNLSSKCPGSFRAFYQTLGGYLARHLAAVHDRNPGQSSGEPVSAHCLVHRSAELLESGDAIPVTCVPSQIGFWAFVLKDAVELHVARTLALIAAHPEVQERVRKEIRSIPTLTPEAIDGLRYLEACFVEQLRLWTPVPILLRRAVEDFSLGTTPIKAGRQILIHAGNYHRDPHVFRQADRFSPDTVDDRFPAVLYFSRHQRSCAGQFVARFLVKATLAFLLDKSRFELIRPGIEPSRIPWSYNHFKIELRAIHDA